MSLFRALVLGIVQGLTEFLPVSSSGHLIIVRWLFGWNLGSPAVEKSFDAASHLGTAIAAFLLLRRDILAIARSFLRRRDEEEARLHFRLGLYVVMASAPAAVAGVFAENFVEEKLGSVLVVGTQLALFGAALLLADRVSAKSRPIDRLGASDAFSIGLAQVLALSPGVSRSGITITAGLLRGLDRAAATRFSFLLLVPITAGAGVFKLAGLLSDPPAPGLLAPFVLGILTSAVSGYAAARGLLAFVKTRSFVPFVIYRIAVGSLIVAAFLSRI